MVVIWSGIALRVFPPKVFECWAGLAARQHKLRRKKRKCPHRDLTWEPLAWRSDMLTTTLWNQVEMCSNVSVLLLLCFGSTLKLIQNCINAKMEIKQYLCRSTMRKGNESKLHKNTQNILSNVIVALPLLLIKCFLEKSLVRSQSTLVGLVLPRGNFHFVPNFQNVHFQKFLAKIIWDSVV